MQKAASWREEEVNNLSFVIEIDCSINMSCFELGWEATVDNGEAVDKVTVTALDEIRHLADRPELAYAAKCAYSVLQLQA